MSAYSRLPAAGRSLDPNAALNPVQRRRPRAAALARTPTISDKMRRSDLMASGCSSQSIDPNDGYGIGRYPERKLAAAQITRNLLSCISGPTASSIAAGDPVRNRQADDGDQDEGTPRQGHTGLILRLGQPHDSR